MNPIIKNHVYTAAPTAGAQTPQNPIAAPLPATSAASSPSRDS